MGQIYEHDTAVTRGAGVRVTGRVMGRGAGRGRGRGTGYKYGPELGIGVAIQG